MSKLNIPNTAVKLGTKKVGYEGNLQDVKTASQQLYELAVMTLYGKDSFYESGDTMLARMEQAVQSVVAAGNLDLVANIIIHARTEMNIRTMPIVLTCLFGKALRDQGKSYDKLRQVTCDVIQRADQITDMYACALNTFGADVEPNQRKRTIPMAIKRGIADSFNKFNEYQVGKYNRNGAVKLRDVLWVTHPKAKSEIQGELFSKIMQEKVETPYTWEVELTKNGALPVAERKELDVVWGELINSGKLGYMALLRNLRNMLQADINDADVDVVATRLQDVDQVLNSKQLPFRFVNALESLANVSTGKVSKLNRGLSRALDISLRNVPKLGNNVWIIIDCSLSMTDHSGYSNRQNNGPVPLKMACLFAAALFKANADANNVAVTMFSDYAKHISKLNGDDSVLTLTEKLMSNAFGGGTNLQSALDEKSRLGFEPDTVIVLSDMQVNRLQGSPTNYFTKDCTKIAIDLAPYETTCIGEVSGWFQLAGWSEKLFDFIPAFKNKLSVVKTLSGPYTGIKCKAVQDEEAA
jgi:60 kDa SS-A/Ro ribonucleoprotein